MSTLFQVKQQINELAQEFISANFKRISARDAGLDSNCGTIFISADAVAVYTVNARSINYYGGFEYVDKDDVSVLGEYTVYSADSDRVWDCIDYYESAQAEEA